MDSLITSLNNIVSVTQIRKKFQFKSFEQLVIFLFFRNNIYVSTVSYTICMINKNFLSQKIIY